MSSKPSAQYNYRTGNIPAGQFDYPRDHDFRCSCNGLGTIRKEWMESRPYRCDCDARTQDLGTTHHAPTCDAVPCPFGGRW